MSQVIADDATAMENDSGIFAIMLVENRSGIAGASDVFGLPFRFASFRIENNHRSFFGTGETDERTFEDKRGGGVTPSRLVTVEVIFEVNDPFLVASFKIVAAQAARFGEVVDEAFVDGRSRSGAAVVVFGGKGLAVGLFPKGLAGFGIEAPKGVLIVLVSYRERTAIRNCEAGAAVANLGFPKCFRAILLDFSWNVTFSCAISIGAKVS